MKKFILFACTLITLAGCENHTESVNKVINNATDTTICKDGVVYFLARTYLSNYVPSVKYNKDGKVMLCELTNTQTTTIGNALNYKVIE